jgi:hypothetical protein
VQERAQNLCEYCRIPLAFAVQPFVVEHIVPVSRGGTNHLSNLACSCGGCNGHKYNKIEATDPVNGDLVPLFNPRNQRWQEHFVWSDDYVLVLGITPTGRATVEALGLNRAGLCNLRRLLFGVGKHPP